MHPPAAALRPGALDLSVLDPGILLHCEREQRALVMEDRATMPGHERDHLDDLAAEVTLFLDQMTFGKLARHMDPAPTPPLRTTTADATEEVQTTLSGQILRPVLRGVLHINCQSCGAPHRIDLDEDGVHVVLGTWNVSDNPVDE